VAQDREIPEGVFLEKIYLMFLLTRGIKKRARNPSSP